MRSARHRARVSSFWQLQASLSLVLIVVGLIGVGVFGLQIYKGQALRPAKTYASIAPVVIHANQFLPRSEPIHISVPSVGIDTKIISVGLDSSGSIEMPPLFDWSAGWYKYSPTPGQLGPSIIVGHVDTYKGVSVFWRLRDIKEGDLVYISRADGKTAKFKVQALKVFDQQDFPTQEIYGNLDYSGLRLITCGGAFNKQTESYTQNTVVYATLEVQAADVTTEALN